MRNHCLPPSLYSYKNKPTRNSDWPNHTKSRILRGIGAPAHFIGSSALFQSQHIVNYASEGFQIEICQKRVNNALPLTRLGGKPTMTYHQPYVQNPAGFRVPLRPSKHSRSRLFKLDLAMMCFTSLILPGTIFLIITNIIPGCVILGGRDGSPVGAFSRSVHDPSLHASSMGSAYG